MTELDLPPLASEFLSEHDILDCSNISPAKVPQCDVFQDRVVAKKEEFPTSLQHALALTAGISFWGRYMNLCAMPTNDEMLSPTPPAMPGIAVPRSKSRAPPRA